MVDVRSNLAESIQNMPNVVTWNGTMIFGAGGNFQNYAKTGWSLPESNITWIDGHEATLEFSMPAPDVDQTLALTVLKVKINAVRHMHAYLNGCFLGLVDGKEGMAEFTLHVNHEYFRPNGSRNTLAFVCPDAVRPSDAGAGPDRRTLSFAFTLLSLYPAE
jgi:hypothetical protein